MLNPVGDVSLMAVALSAPLKTVRIMLSEKVCALVMEEGENVRFLAVINIKYIKDCARHTAEGENVA